VAVMPGAVWRPITVPGGLTRRTSKGRAVVLHVAVSEATSLFGFFNNNPSANSHFYVAKDGTIEQYVDTDYQSWASMQANASTISVETQGGVTDPDGEPWTAAQVASLARICAWAHATEGTPLAPMLDSKPASTGVGYHKLGINPWRVSGGEIWSSSVGKICPGAAKIAQIPAIIAAAISGTEEDDMPLTPKDEADIAKYGSFEEAVAQRTRQVIATAQLPYGLDNLRLRLEAIDRKVTALAAAQDPKALAAAIAADLPPSGGPSEADLEAALRKVLGSLDNAA
jgi:hypothetical protein